jgi:mono/diheme cytochrome c family protein
MSQIRTAFGAALVVWAIILLVAAADATNAQAVRTLQDGVFTDAQSTRGQALYAQRCAGCHGPDLTGGAQAPPLDGPVFRSRWRQEPLSALFIKIRYTMPPNAPDSATLTGEQGADLVAHILKTNRFPSGEADFTAADAATSTIGWPSAPSTDEPPPTVTARYSPTGTVNQLMRSIFFHNANLLCAVQEVDPKDLPGQPWSDKPGGITIFDQGLMTYTGWLALENAATALADASTLLLQPGLRCQNGQPAPIAEPDWIRFTDRTTAAARRMYRLAQMRDKEAMSEFSLELSNSCNACHSVYRLDGGRGRGRGATPGAASGVARCMHR